MIIERKHFWHTDLEPLILSNHFAYYNIVGGTSSENYSGFAHSLIDRYDIFKTKNMPIMSEYWHKPFSEVFFSFVDYHGIKVDQICRAAVNLTTHVTDSLHGDAHVDHNYPHKVFLYYLNECSEGHTYIFGKYDGDRIKYNPGKANAIIRHEKNKAVCFDGLYYHAQGFCGNNERRIVLVVTFTEK